MSGLIGRRGRASAGRLGPVGRSCCRRLSRAAEGGWRLEWSAAGQPAETWAAHAVILAVPAGDAAEFRPPERGTEAGR